MKLIIKAIWLILVFYLLREVFSEFLVEIGINYDIDYITQNRYENLGFLKNVGTLVFGLIYVPVHILLFYKQKSVIRLFCNILDFSLIFIAVIYAILIIIAMNHALGEAAFGLVLLPIAVIIIFYAFYSIHINRHISIWTHRKST